MLTVTNDVLKNAHSVSIALLVYFCINFKHIQLELAVNYADNHSHRRCVTVILYLFLLPIEVRI